MLSDIPGSFDVAASCSQTLTKMIVAIRGIHIFANVHPATSGVVNRVECYFTRQRNCVRPHRSLQTVLEVSEHKVHANQRCPMNPAKFYPRQLFECTSGAEIHSPNHSWSRPFQMWSGVQQQEPAVVVARDRQVSFCGESGTVAGD